MRRRRSHSQFHEPSLVPLADMLTNTVGIMVFILIFTVLTAGGVVLVKRLPKEHLTGANPVSFVCIGGRILPLNHDALTNQFLRPLGKPTSYDAVDTWIKRFNARQVDDEFFVAKGEGEAIYSTLIIPASVRLDLTIAFTARAGVGETSMELDSDNSRFREILQSYQPNAHFVHFIVYPDSLDLFFKARSIAVENMRFGYGWWPQKNGEPYRLGLTGSGLPMQEQ